MPQNIMKANGLFSNESFHCYCSHCDGKLIKSEKDGNLYRVFGHVTDDGERNTLASYEPVYFSLCHECDTLSAVVEYSI